MKHWQHLVSAWKQQPLYGLIVLLLLAQLTFTTESLADDGARLIKVFPLTAPRISSTFGNRFHPIKKYTSHHGGVDLAAPSNAHVRSVGDGQVIFSGTYGGYGKLVTVMHQDKYSSLYGHLDEVLVNVGDKVTAGQLIGRVGSTGTSTAPHLHFEWRYDGKPLNPLKVLPELRSEPEG